MDQSRNQSVVFGALKIFSMQISPEDKRAGQFRMVLQIALVALIVRLLVAIMAYGGKDIVAMLWPRGVEALGIARSLIHGEGFSSPFALPTGPTAFLPPVYPVMLAAIEHMFGLATKNSAWAILVMQCMFSALTCIPIYYLALETFDRRIAKRAMLIWALFPYAIMLPTNIIWESSLSALLLAAGLYFFVRAQSSESNSRWALLGIFWAVACLVNAALLLLLPALLIFQVLRNSKVAPCAVWCAGIFILCLLPWSVRNYAVFHKAFPLRDNFALELWIGNHEGATTRFTPEIHPAFSRTEILEYQRLGEIGYMSHKREIALEFIRKKPVLFLRNTVQRFFTYWLVSWHSLWLLVPILSVIGFAGMALLLHRSHPLSWLYFLPMLIYPLPYYLTHPDLRYQHPLQPLLTILAAYALASQAEKKQDGESISAIAGVHS
jgi:4-amino-4-deoxy-L-arabinose transferase-like glycosyltransferase